MSLFAKVRPGCMLLLAVVLSAAGLIASPTAHADPGDNLASFDPVEMTCPYGSSVAFDGAKLYSSCWGSNVLYRISPVNGAQIGSGQAIVGLGEIGAMAWDGGKLWVCSNTKIYTINTTTFVAQFMFDTIPPLTQEPCRDGLAYDRSDDSLWLSGDGDNFIYKFTSSGVYLATYTPGAPIAGAHSGLAVSGSTIYVANPHTNVIYACNKTPSPFTSCSVAVASAGPPTGHQVVEDLECDSQTFAPKHAIWNESQENPYMTAWEVPAGSCVTGGGPTTAVGGAVELLTSADSPAAASGSSSARDYTPPVAAAVAAAVVAVALSGWYVRRRWLG